MANDREQDYDEIARILAADPNATVVAGKAQAWLLTGNTIEIARAAVARSRQTPESAHPSEIAHNTPRRNA
jgi:hypothetical protein